MVEAQPSAAERTLIAQLDSVRFLAGVDQGKWERLGLVWPYLYVRAHGRDPDTGKQFTQDFRLDCEGFPEPGPLVERWTYAEGETRGQRPPPPSSGSPGFIDALKDWEVGIYRAWSRTAANHNNWATIRPDQAWNRHRSIVFIMEKLYELATEQAIWLASHPST